MQPRSEPSAAPGAVRWYDHLLDQAVDVAGFGVESASDGPLLWDWLNSDHEIPSGARP